VNETGVRNRLDAPETFLGRPHPQGLEARGISGNLDHPTTYPNGRTSYDEVNRGPGHPSMHIGQSCQEADVMGSLPGGETVYPKSSSLNGNRYLDVDKIPGTAHQPIVTNPEGGKQSAALGRYDLIPGEALTRVAQVLEYGLSPVPGVRDGYPAGNWKKIPGYQHINHALEHLSMFAMGRTDEDHVGHALTRLCFAAWAEVNRGDMHEERLEPK
jgi:hypothetical protein